MITMDAVGDIMAGDHPHFLGIGIGSAIKEGLYVFKHVEDIFSKADIVFGNLETVLSDYGKTNSYESLILRGTSNFINQLKKSHFNVLNVANNHIQQHGEKCLFDTVSTLQQSGIKVIGIDSLQPQIIFSKDIKLGFLGYSLRPERYNSNIFYSHGNKAKIISDIEEVKRKVDYIIISLHWGDEYIHLPSISQIRFAHDIIDAGADIILSHHPHVLQPVEKYKEGIIAYSLGNFVSDMCSEVTKKSVILRIILNKYQPTKAELIPIYINENYQPEKLANNEVKRYSYDILQTKKLLNLVKSIDYQKTLYDSIRKDRCEYFKFLIVNFYKFSIPVLCKIIYNAIKRIFHNER